MRKVISAVLVGVIALVPISMSIASTIKPGTPCSKVGLKQIQKNRIFTCVKVKGKLVWNAGVAVKSKSSKETKPAATPSPSAASTSSPSPSPSPSPSQISNSNSSPSPSSNWKDPLDGKPCTNIYEKIPNQIFELVCVPYKESHPGSTDTTLYWAQNNHPGNFNFPSPAPIPLPNVSYKAPTVASLNVSTCQIQENSKVRKDLPTGFPRISPLTPNSGTLKWALIPVDFADLPGEKDFRSRIDEQLKLASDWYETVSGGRMKIEWVVAKDWVRLQGSSADYKIPFSDDPTRSPQVRDFFRRALPEADKVFDFTGIKTVNFILPKGQRIVPESGQGFPWDAEMKITTTQEGALNTFSILGGVFEVRGATYWEYWTHEFGHAIGIPHVGSSRISTPFQALELMGSNGGPARDLAGWLRYVEGWLEDNQVYCQDASNLIPTELTLVPLNDKTSGIKMAVVKINDAKAVIIESRRVTKFGCTTESYREGVLVYSYDATKGHNEEMFVHAVPAGRKFESAACYAPQTQDPLLRAGDKVTFEGITIEVTAHGTLDQIKISK